MLALVKVIWLTLDLLEEVCGPEKATLGDLINHNVLLAHSVYQVKFSLCHHDDNGELGRRRGDTGDRPGEPFVRLRGGGEWQGRRQLAHLGHHHHLVHLGQRQESTAISSEAKAAHREVVQYRDLLLLQKVSHSTKV